MKWAMHLHFCAKIKNEWSCTYTPCICLHGADGDNFTLYRDSSVEGCHKSHS